MLFQFLLYSFISIVCFWSGCVFYGIVYRLNNRKYVYERPLINYLITGFIMCAGFAQLAVLFIPLNAIVTWIYLLVLVIFSFISRKELFKQLTTVRQTFLKPEFRTTALLITPIIFMIAVLNAGPTIMDDTDSYHIQMVKWIETYGTVPGIANLHMRFGLNSSWFVAAGFFLPDTDSTACLALNGVLSIWLGTFLISRISLFFHQKISAKAFSTSIAALVVLVIALVNWPLLRGNAASLNYDFITTAVLIILFFQVLSGKAMHTELFLWPCFLFTVRIINYPFLLVSFLVLIMFWNNARKKQIWMMMIAGIILIAPFLARNIYLSGYPFYPLQIPQSGFGDWQADPAVMSEYVEYTRAFNRVNEQHQPIEKTLQLSFPQWVGYWYRYLFTWDKVIVTLAIAGLLITSIQYAKSKKILPNAAWWILIGCFLQLVSWFIVSPDPRFAFGPLLIFIASAVILMLPVINERNLSIIMRVTTVIILGAVVTYTARKVMLNAQNRNWIKPDALPKPAVERQMILGITFFIPLKIEGNWNARCYNTSLPCLYKIDPRLRPRGKDIRDGFTIRQPGVR